MPTILEFEEAARRRLERGVATLASTVQVTLGPKGRNVVIGQDYGPPVVVTNDGVRIAKVLHLDDPHENLGLQLAREVANRTNEHAGDGTTTATVLAGAMVRRGLRAVTAGASPVAVKRGIDAAAAAVCDWLHAAARPISSEPEIAAVASISAQDPTIGALIAEACLAGGQDAVIHVQEKPSLGVELDRAPGLRFDRGYLSPHLVTDDRRDEAVLDDPYVLICQRKISAAADLIPVLGRVQETGRPLFIIAEDVDGEALTLLVANKLRGTLAGMAVKAPLFGERRKEMLDDIAVLTGGQVVSPDVGMDLRDVGLNQLGTAERVVVDMGYSTIIGGGGGPEDIESHKAKIRIHMESMDSSWDREKQAERLARLSGGLSVIKVGAATEVELRERKYRIEDAIAATQAAREEGVVAGGGAALVQAQTVLDDDLGRAGDERTGVRAVREALAEPQRLIAENAGANGDVVATLVRDQPAGYGFNAASGQYGDLIAEGVIDPVKVTVSALTNAASIAGLILTTDALVAAKPEPRGPLPPGPENLDPDDD